MNSFVRLNDAAAALGISRQTLYRWSHANPAALPIVKINPGAKSRASGIPSDALDAFIERHQRAA